MSGEGFRANLDELRAGKLSPSELSKMGAYAKTALPELMEYTEALEQAYRTMELNLRIARAITKRKEN